MSILKVDVVPSWAVKGDHAKGQDRNRWASGTSIEACCLGDPDGECGKGCGQLLIGLDLRFGECVLTVSFRPTANGAGVPAHRGKDAFVRPCPEPGSRRRVVATDDLCRGGGGPIGKGPGDDAGALVETPAVRRAKSPGHVAPGPAGRSCPRPAATGCPYQRGSGAAGAPSGRLFRLNNAMLRSLPEESAETRAASAHGPDRQAGDGEQGVGDRRPAGPRHRGCNVSGRRS